MMQVKKVWMVCNAHLDPVWQWDWEEGLAVALSTFRSAVRLSEEFDFIFAHNEAMLYAWVEQYDPPLFARIRELVAAGKWKIMGGWYLQPDCNLPSAESLIRQIGVGKAYFQEKFGVSCEAAVNFDSFGHGYGMVQILRKTGYEGYVFCRPVMAQDDFWWEGPDGSRIRAHGASGFYNSPMGMARKKIECEMERREGAPCVLVLWGVGNHGGGPSREDLRAVAALAAERPETEFRYGVPEDYFRERDFADAPVVRRSLNPVFPGCYLSQARVKKLHRRLENELYASEKLLSVASLAGADYPAQELREVEKLLLMSEFHDILSGTSVRPAEEGSLLRMAEGLSRLKRLKVVGLCALARHQPPAKAGEFPVLVWNPQPREVETVLEIPIMLEDHFEGRWTRLQGYGAAGEFPSQMVKEDSNVDLDWSKKVAVRVRLAPLGLTRIDFRQEIGSVRPELLQPAEDFVFAWGDFRAVVARASGLLEELTVGGRSYLSGPAFAPVLLEDNEDPWAMQEYQHRRLGGAATPLRLASPAEAGKLCGCKTAPPVRLIEDGEVRRTVESVFVAEGTYAVLQFVFDVGNPTVEVRVELHFEACNKLVKLLVPAALAGEAVAEIAAGEEALAADGAERPMQRWCALRGEREALAVLNDGCYAFSAEGSVLGLSLVRGVAYTAHYLHNHPLLRQDRFHSRVDQGEHRFRFRLLAGRREEVLRRLPAEAALFNEPPFAMCLFPDGAGAKREEEQVSLVGDEEILLEAMKRSADGSLLFRLYNGAAEARACLLRVGKKTLPLQLKPFELVTCRDDGGSLARTAGLEI